MRQKVTTNTGRVTKKKSWQVCFPVETNTSHLSQQTFYKCKVKLKHCREALK